MKLSIMCRLVSLYAYQNNVSRSFLPSGEVRDPISVIASYFPKRLSILLIYDVSLPAVAAFTMR